MSAVDPKASNKKPGSNPNILQKYLDPLDLACFIFMKLFLFNIPFVPQLMIIIAFLGLLVYLGTISLGSFKTK